MQRTFLSSLAVLAAVTVSPSSSLEAQSGRWGADYFPNVPVVTQDGKTLRFYDELIKGKIMVISFIYTNCQDICPLTTARMAQVEEKLGDVVGRDMFLYSITVDPEHDSPEKLKKYAQAFDAGPGWLFLTGEPGDIRSINYKLGNRSLILSEHRNEVVLGNDATGEWQRDSVFGDLDRLVMTIRAMDPKWRDQVRIPQKSAASDTGLALGGEPGQALFKKICAPCHTIGVGDRVGPDLRGVTARRDRAWLSSYIGNPGKMRTQNDAAALALAAKYDGVRMPPLGISENDIADLIAYLEAQTARLEVGPDAPPGHHQHHH